MSYVVFGSKDKATQVHWPKNDRSEAKKMVTTLYNELRRNKHDVTADELYEIFKANEGLKKENGFFHKMENYNKGKNRNYTIKAEKGLIKNLKFEIDTEEGRHIQKRQKTEDTPTPPNQNDNVTAQKLQEENDSLILQLNHAEKMLADLKTAFQELIKTLGIKKEK